MGGYGPPTKCRVCSTLLECLHGPQDHLHPRQIGSDPQADRGLQRRSDPRQWELFTAAWAAGSYKYLAEAGAASVTYFEAVGPAGLKPSGGSGVFPVYHPIRFIQAVTRQRGSAIVPMNSSSPSSAGAFGVATDDGVHTAVFSLAGESIAVTVEGLGTDIKLHELNAETFRGACADPERFWQLSEARTCEQGRLEIELGPYGLAFIGEGPA